MNEPGSGISRRDFLKGSAACLALTGLGLPRPILASGDDGGPALAVAAVGDPASLTRRAVDGLGGMGAFVRAGQSVLVKPNIGWDRSPEQAANTHPEVVRAIVSMCLEAGADRVTIADRTCNDARRCYTTSGMAGMVEALGDRRVRLEFVPEDRFRPLAIPQGRLLREWPVTEAALEADVLINAPIAKHHSIGSLTLGMKNLMGVLGGNRGSFHSNIGQKLADIATAIRPALNVLDATRILVRNGPTGGSLEDVKVLDTVAASADLVAIDAFGATLFGLSPGRVPSIAAGASMGIGQMDLAKVRRMDL